MLVRDLMKIIHRVAPPDLAAEWDNSGLQIGSPLQPVSKIGLALDVTPQTLQEALRLDCDLLLAHHPLIFKPLKNIQTDREPGSLIQMALAGGLAVVAAHTNWDSARRGVAQALASWLGLKNCRPLEATGRDFCKLVVFVPLGYESRVRAALFEAGAGHIGDYDRSWFGSPGEGGYRVPKGGQPFIGEPGLETRTSESRVEVIVPRSLADQAARAVLASHPYEEPAFEFHQVKIYGRDQGLGLIGEWNQERDWLAEMARLNPAYKMAGPNRSLVKQVALLPGSGGSYAKLAHSQGAEAYITGDVSYHDALTAEGLGLSLVDVGHFESEWPGVLRLAEVLREELAREKIEVTCEVLEQSPVWHYGENPRRVNRA